ncbi:MAG: tape measure protein [Rhodobacteraceae bacterium]|nr:tape measure protein [Paracoccaceae bacterium]
MPIDNTKLIAVLSANIRNFERSMDRASGKANYTFKKIEHRGKLLQKRLNAIDPKFARFLGPAAIGATIRAFQVFADSATRIENALKVAGVAGDELERVYDRLEASAKKNFAPLEALANLYAKTSLAQKELKVTSEELLKFTDNIALALRVSGKTASESRGALIQLTQAMGAGIVRAEEFNAILEGALPVAQAAAAGLKEAGGSVAKLRTLVIDGKISSEVFFRAFEAGASILEEKLAGATLTTGQAFENLKTSLTSAARKIDDATGLTKYLTQHLKNLADAADLTGDVFDRLTGKVGAFEQRSTEYLQSTRKTVEELIAQNAEIQKQGFGSVEKFFGTDKRRIQEEIDLKKQLVEIDKQIIANLGNRISESFEGSGSGVDGKAALNKALEEQKKLLRISLGDYDAPTSSTKKKTPSEKFDTDISRIQARTLSIQAETAAQAKLNPLIDDYEYAITKAAAVQDLLNEAKKAGLEITPQLRETINGLAEGYANATVEANQLTESQDRLVDTAEDLKGLGKSVLSGFIDDLRNGVSAADAFKNALNRIADKLIDMAIQNLFANALGGSSYKGGGGGGNFLSSLFDGGSVGSASDPWKGLRGMAEGGYTGNGGVNEAAGVVHGQEFVVNAAATKKNRGLLESINAGKMVSPRALAVPMINATSQNGQQRTRVEVILSPDLQARILDEAAGQSVQISRDSITTYDTYGAPERIQKTIGAINRYPG